MQITWQQQMISFELISRFSFSFTKQNDYSFVNSRILLPANLKDINSRRAGQKGITKSR
jgi:hypothetical protein